MSKRIRLQPNRWTGWKPDLKVEVELIDRSNGGGSLYAVWLNDVRVGWVHGYQKYSRGQAGWAYVVGEDRPSYGAFGYHAGESRRAMVEHLVEVALR